MLPAKLDVGFPVHDVKSGTMGLHACFFGGEIPSSHLKCWGFLNALGFDSSLPIADYEDPSTYPLSDLPSPVVELSAGSRFTCAVFSDDSIRCWGYNEYGKAARADCTFCDTAGDPVNLGQNFTPRDVASGYQHACALGTSGSVKCWGVNRYGELGYGDSTERGRDPALLGDALPEVPLGGAATAIAVGCDFSCALLVDGTVKCWGRAMNGALGQPALTGADLLNNLGDEPGEVDELPPIDLGPDSRVVQIAVGCSSACALLDTDEVKCWGWNRDGQLGVRTDDDIVGDDPREMGAALKSIEFR
ncbi:MAG: hypothetical protein DIU78_015540 [Pseudomonadota bacterium]